MVILNAIWTGISFILGLIWKVIWAIISFVFNLLWEIIKHYWYIILIVGIVAFVVWIIIASIKNTMDEKWLERYERNRPPDDKKLEIIAKKVCAKFRRVKLNSVSYLRVYIDVTSQTGNSTWQCIIDFDDEKKLTGEYQILSDNDQSNIPQYVADAIRNEIRNNTF